MRWDKRFPDNIPAYRGFLAACKTKHHQHYKQDLTHRHPIEVHQS